MKKEVEALVELIRLHHPDAVPKILGEQFFEYLDNKEYGLAFELLAFNLNAHGLIAGMHRDIKCQAALIIQQYKIADFSKLEKMSKIYADIFRLAKNPV